MSLRNLNASGKLAAEATVMPMERGLYHLEVGLPKGECRIEAGTCLGPPARRSFHVKSVRSPWATSLTRSRS